MTEASGRGAPQKDVDPAVLSRIVGAHGFEALRGQQPGGAAALRTVEAWPIAGLPESRNTLSKRVRSAVKTPPKGAKEPTALDAAIDYLFDWDRNGGRAGFSFGMALLKPLVQLDAPNVAEAIRGLLRVTIDDAISETNRFLTGMAIQASALDYIREDRMLPVITDPVVTKNRNEVKRWATWTVDKRRQEWASTTAAYEKLLSVCLLHLRRRPLPDYTLADIVRSAQALWAGSIFRAFTEPEHYAEYWEDNESRSEPGPLGMLPKGGGRIERAMSDLIFGMTQPSVFAINTDRPLRARMLHAALSCYQGSNTPVTLEAVAAVAQVDVSVAAELFADPSALAEACFEQLGGRWPGFTEFVDGFTTEAFPPIKGLLIWITQIATEYPSLLSSFDFVNNSAAYRELAAIIAGALTSERIGQSGVVPPAARNKADRLIHLAATGSNRWRDLLDHG